MSNKGFRKTNKDAGMSFVCLKNAVTGCWEIISRSDHNHLIAHEPGINLRIMIVASRSAGIVYFDKR